MKLTLLAQCSDGSCPGVYLTEHGTVVVQGRVVSDEEVPAGEIRAELPANLIIEAARKLQP